MLPFKESYITSQVTFYAENKECTTHHQRHDWCKPYVSDFLCRFWYSLWV